MRALIFSALLLVGSAAWSQTMVASVEPLAKLLRSLYGPSVTVQTLLEANQNPHHLALSPRQALMVQQADLVVWLGSQADPALVPLIARRSGHSLALLSLPGVARLQGHGHDEQAHGEHADDDHDATLNPHLWLSPRNMTLLATALAEQYPDGLAEGQPAAFDAALAEHQARWQQALEPWASTAWLTYHHPWGYLTGPLGLAEPVVVTRQLGAGPGSQRFVALAGQIEKEKIRCAIVEPEARQSLLKKLCSDCRMTPLDPLGRGDTPATYVPWLDTLVDGFRQCLSGEDA
ncbi:high-affinity zinc uptake system protein znuA [Alcanivorax hongdengensis A-11-3]|uniref:High-affinity zinc uptake system protein ZnuA n=1 Tax=Alcanivorax hongdengensis A-11-3 TaxID=1177179 RepID=L0W8Y4_9GAMM|nr:zinc ABC transporter substrate-binding protein [Alcanivorax hongdengensis]EKF73424.1 high-affinity zinc uptake system protein znuA [Alcanivorax hongdengensis A-11-3]